MSKNPMQTMLLRLLFSQLLAHLKAGRYDLLEKDLKQCIAAFDEEKD